MISQDTKFKVDLVNLVTENTKINKEIFPAEVKRGLRNSNGTGVLVGATRISKVVGYETKDNKVIPSEGDLQYRGYSIYDLVEAYQQEKRFGYEEVIYLLLFGDLPDKEQMENFKTLLIENMKLPNFFVEDVIIRVPCENIMNKLQRVVLGLYSYDENPEDLSVENQLAQALSIIAKMPLLVAYSYVGRNHYFDEQSLYIHNSREDLSIAENILYLIRQDNAYTDLEAETLDLCLIIHAEHGGGNNSTFATHVVSSSGTDTYSAISTAIGSLKGPKHGGANAKVEAMLKDLKENTADWHDASGVENYLRRVLNKEVFDKKGLIYGIGHAIYTLSDPRCTLLKAKAKELAVQKGLEDEFELLNTIENLSIKLIKERKGEDAVVCANVDLYAGLVYKMLGLNEELFTPMFALARSAGWCAHRLEQIQDEKIIRPAYVTLVDSKEYVPLSSRE